jgi:signal transduction histidine kinase
MTAQPPAQPGNAARPDSWQPSAPLRLAVWVLALGGPALLTLAALPLQSVIFRGGCQFSALVLVVTLAVVGGMRPALTALLLTILGQALFFAPRFMNPRIGLLPSAIGLAAFAVAGLAVSMLTGRLSHLSAEQAAFRRVALLVAQMVPERQLFAAAAEEAGRLMGADYVCLGRCESGGIVSVGAWMRPTRQLRIDGRWPVIRSITRGASQADRWTAIGDLAGMCGPLADNARSHNIRPTTVLPIRVGERPWGMLLAGSATRRAPKACPRRCADSFADLLGAAVSNAESVAELMASRARVLAATDEARHQIERDLHDGAQQRLVSLTLALRVAQATAQPVSYRLGDELGSVADGLASVLDDLRQLARGIHPTTLSQGGLVPALKALARRSTLPVELDAQDITRLPEPVEVAAYYVVSEALANAAKYSHASVVRIGAEIAANVLHLRIIDDGDGGADPAAGSGLVGLKDRVEAIGGRIAVQSPAGAGTSLDAELPLAA